MKTRAVCLRNLLVESIQSRRSLSPFRTLKGYGDKRRSQAKRAKLPDVEPAKDSPRSAASADSIGGEISRNRTSVELGKAAWGLTDSLRQVPAGRKLLGMARSIACGP